MSYLFFFLHLHVYMSFSIYPSLLCVFVCIHLSYLFSFFIHMSIIMSFSIILYPSISRVFLCIYLSYIIFSLSTCLNITYTVLTCLTCLCSTCLMCTCLMCLYVCVFRYQSPPPPPPFSLCDSLVCVRVIPTSVCMCESMG